MVVDGGVKCPCGELLVCNVLACALSGANTIVGGGTELRHDQEPRQRARRAAAGIASLGHAPAAQERVPRRIGCSTNRNEAIAGSG